MRLAPAIREDITSLSMRLHRTDRAPDTAIIAITATVCRGMGTDTAGIITEITIGDSREVPTTISTGDRRTCMNDCTTGSMTVETTLGTIRETKRPAGGQDLPRQPRTDVTDMIASTSGTLFRATGVATGATGGRSVRSVRISRIPVTDKMSTTEAVVTDKMSTIALGAV